MLTYIDYIIYGYTYVYIIRYKLYKYYRDINKFKSNYAKKKNEN